MTSSRGRFQRFALAGLGIAAMFVAGRTYLPTASAQSGTSGGPAVSQQEVARLESISSTFRTVAKHVKPTVVQIESTVEATPEKNQLRRQLPKDLPKDLEPFRQFFEQFGEMPQQPMPESGRGSGVIIDPEHGYILTNNHVVGGKDKGKEQVRLDVTLDNGRKVQATVVGQDPKTDIALIKIKDSDMKALQEAGVKLEPIKLGDSTKMEVGDWVLAIGAPFGLAQTVTQGIISATGRNNVGIAGIEDFLQTDAAINPGNSGGPLVNMRGELIGINTAIATTSRGYMGIGFAIPSEMIKQVLPDLKEGREIVRGYLGVAIKGLDQEPGLARTFGLKEDRGVLIEDVRPDTPASKAGLKGEDVVLEADGKKLESASQLQSIVAQTKPGETLNLDVWRDGKQITIPVKIEAQPADFYSNRGWSGGGKGGTPGSQDEETETTIESVGMTVTKVTPELAKKYNWNYDEVKGQLIVTQVEPLGEAGALRITAGDLVLSVQGEPMKTPAALKKALSAKLLADGVRLRVRSEYGYRSLLLQVTP